MISPQIPPKKRLDFSRLRKNVNYQLSKLLAAAIAMCSTAASAQDISTPPPAQSFDAPVTLRPAPVTLRPGSVITYESHTVVHPLRPPVREDYVITIQEKWPAGVVFRYEVTQSVIGTESGIQALSSLDACTSLDPWWDPSETDHDDRCELWITPKNLRELKTIGKTYLAVDTVVRKDSVVRWELAGRTLFLCEIDGRPALLNAIRIHTTRDDEFIILDDPENPLVLSASSTYFSWNIVKIQR